MSTEETPQEVKARLNARGYIFPNDPDLPPVLIEIAERLMFSNACWLRYESDHLAFSLEDHRNKYAGKSAAWFTEKLHDLHPHMVYISHSGPHYDNRFGAHTPFYDVRFSISDKDEERAKS